MNRLLSRLALSNVPLSKGKPLILALHRHIDLFNSDEEASMCSSALTGSRVIAQNLRVQLVQDAEEEQQRPSKKKIIDQSLAELPTVEGQLDNVWSRIVTTQMLIQVRGASLWRSIGVADCALVDGNTILPSPTRRLVAVYLLVKHSHEGRQWVASYRPYL